MDPIPTPLAPIAAATEALQLALGQLLAAQAAPQSTATLRDVAEAWLAYSAPLRTPSTIRGYRSDIKALLERLGDQPIAALTRPTVELAIDEVPHGRWNALTRCWRACISWAVLRAYPVGHLKPALRAHKADRHSYGEWVWRRAVFALAVAYRDAEPRSRAAAGAALLAVLCGVRRSPCATMRWDQVDTTTGLWTVKDKKATRVVHLGPIAWPLVLSQPRRGPWVWPARRGSKVPHVGPDRLSAHARAAFTGIDDLEGLTLHQAGRHAAACAALARGASLADVAGFLGHVDLRVSSERYAAPANGAHARAVLLESLAELGEGRALLAVGPTARKEDM